MTHRRLRSDMFACIRNGHPTFAGRLEVVLYAVTGVVA